MLPKTVGRCFVGLQGFVMSAWDPYGQLHGDTAGFMLLCPSSSSVFTWYCPVPHSSSKALVHLYACPCIP